jgi:uncharacterized RDD family membrane protein YckC
VSVGSEGFAGTTGPSGGTVPPSGATGRATGPRAGFWIRFGAAFLDGIILGIVDVILRAVLKGAGFALGELVAIAYAVYFIGSPRGQTLGQRACGLRTISIADGGSIGYGRALLRWVVGLVSAFCILIGYLWAIWDPEKQTWHDKAAGSIVVPVAQYPF